MAGQLTQPNEAIVKATNSHGYVIGPGEPFVCPHAEYRVYALHHWGYVANLDVYFGSGAKGTRPISDADNVLAAKCSSCSRESIFVNNRLLFPVQSAAPGPGADMPDEIVADFEEARQILPVSTRGAAALLRLVIQKLLPYLGATKSEINAGIGELVARGVINPQLQQALDSVRIIGNEAVHPGTMDLQDDEATALALFGLVNFIILKAISEPKQIAAIYGSLPANKVDGINQRDGKNVVPETS